MINQVEIQLKEYGNLDLIEGVNVPLVYNIDDIKNFGNRKSNFSKTIKIPGTYKNNQIMKTVYEIKSDTVFDMTIRHECILLVDKNPIIIGFMKLNSIDRMGSMVVYNVNIYDEIKSLFSDLGEKKLSDLDFSSGFTFQDVTYLKGDHSYDITTAANYVESGQTYTNVCTYVPVNYGYPNYSYGGNIGYPFFSQSLSQLYPSVYFRSIVDKIFSEAGWNYQSNFFSGSTYDGIFNKILNIYNRERIFTNINLYQYWSDSNTDFSGRVYFEKQDKTYDGDNWGWYELMDFRDDYNFRTGYTEAMMYVPKNGNYKVKLFFDVADDEGGANDSSRPCTDGDATYYKLYLREKDASEAKWLETILSTDLGQHSGGTFSYQSTYLTELVGANEGDYFYLIAYPGTVCIDDDFNPPTYTNTQRIFLDINTIGFELIYQHEDENFIDLSGTTIPLGNFLPDMKQSDFLRNIIKLFNLYLWVNKSDTNSKLLYIEPRDDFYDDGTTRNWTTKIDWDKKITITDLTKEINREFRFKYNKGTDYYSEQYQDIFGLPFGSYDFEVVNDYIKGEYNIEVEWTSLQYFQHIIAYNASSYVPSKTTDDDEEWFDKIKNSNPLLGLIDVVSTNGIGDFFSGDNYFIDSNFKYGGGNKNKDLNNIINALHILDWAGHWYDLNFKTTINAEVQPSKYDDQYVYKVFWENYIDNITNKNARMVTYYVNLNLSDIIKLDFRDTIIIDGQQYIIDKIDYDPTKNSSSRVQLLKKKVIE